MKRYFADGQGGDGYFFLMDELTIWCSRATVVYSASIIRKDTLNDGFR